ncbi:hypothetical protein [Gemmatimonas sp.]|uniref:hypothetical protein n=1 Tax=Gemmatimonas sp. TaxID=1962908 RepID=UPI00286E958D|nr:hypothetical protein [Gemmatimonas sp.]
MLKFLNALLKLITVIAGKPAPPPPKRHPQVTLGLSMSKVIHETSADEKAANEDAARRERIANSRRQRPQTSAEVALVRIAKDDVRDVIKAMPFEDHLHAHYVSQDVHCYRLTLLETGQQAFVLFSPGEEWIDVLSPVKLKDYSYVEPSRFKRYGFSRDMSRWSYGDGPPGARAIRAALRTLDPTIQSRERV